MKVAIPTWSERVSPVFDVARRLMLVDLEGDVEAQSQEIELPETEPVARARRLVELGVEVLICGAISAPLENMLVSSGVRVVAHNCGPTREVLQAFCQGQLTDDRFLMPGCRRRRRFRGGRGGGRRGSDLRGDLD